MSCPSIAESRAPAIARALPWLAVALLAWPAATAEAQTRRTWSGSTDTLWSTGSNWFGNAAPSGSSDTIVFDSAGTYASGTTSILPSTSVTISGIVLTNPSADVVITGTSNTNNDFTINGTGIDMSNATKNLSINAGRWWVMNSGTLNVASGRTLTINWNSTSPAATFTSGTTTIAGAGLVSFSKGWYVGRNANAATEVNITSGTTSISSGIVLGGASGSNTSTIKVSNATLTMTALGVGAGGSFSMSSGTTTMSDMNNASWNGKAQITINGGVFTQTGNWRGSSGVANNTNESVTLTFAGGTSTLFQLPSTRGTGANLNVNFNGGVFRPAATSTIFFGTTAASANLYAGTNGALIDTNTFNLTLAQPIMNGTAAGTVGFLRKLGSGTLTLSASNSYTGVTQINAGTLNLGSVDALAGSTLDMNSGDAGSLVFGVTGTNTYNLGGLIGPRNLATSGSANMSVGANGTSGTYSGILSGAGALTKVGSGTLTLAGANTYGGATTVSGGVLALGASNVLSGSTAVTISTGVLDTTASNFSGSVGAFTISSGTLAGGGTITTGTYVLSGGVVNANLGSGTVNVSGNAALNGTAGATTVNLNAGTLTLGSGSRLTGANVAVTGSSGASLTLGGNESFGSLAGAADMALGGNTLTVGSANVTGTFSGILSGVGGGLTKIGAGALTLSGSNTFSGQTRVEAGVLALGAANVISNQSNLLVNGGGFNLAGYSDTVGSVTLTSGSIFGTGTLGGSSYALQGGTLASNLGSGAITVSTGTTTLGSAGRFNSTSGLTVSSGQLTLGGDESIASYTQSGGSLGGTAKLTAATYGLGGGTMTANLGSGTVNVTANSSLNGTSDATTVNLNAGALTLGSGGTRFTSSSVAVSGSAGASLTLGGNESFGSLAGAANIALGTNTLSVGGANTSTNYAGNLSGSGMLAKLGSGTFTLSGNNSHSGGTQIAAGTLRLGSSTALPTSSAVTLGTGSTSSTLDFNANTVSLGAITFNGNGSQLSAGGKLQLLASGTNNATINVTSGSHALHPDTSLQSNAVIDVNPGAIFSLHGVIDGTKSLTKIGSGTLTINGANTYSGGSYLSGGYVSALTTGALGSGTVTIGNNTTLDLNNTILNNTVVFSSGSGAIINSGTLVNVTGTFSVTSGTGSSITTNYNVLAGGDISFVNALASTVQVQGGAAVTFTADVLAGAPSASVFVNAGGRGAFSGSVLGDVTTSGSSLFSGSVAGNVTVGGGTATFSGPTSLGSAVNVNAGLAVLSGTIGGIAHATAAAATVEIRGRVASSADVNAEAGGTVKLMGNQAFEGTTIDNDGSVIIDRTASLMLGAVISGSGSLTKSDTLTLALTGNNTYSGLTTIAGGTLSVGNGGTSGALSGNVVNNAALLFNRSDATSYAGNISGSGAVTKLGSGKLMLTGSSSYSGGTTVEGGILSVNGQIGGNATVLAGGTLGGSGAVGGTLSGAGLVSPGNSPGILTASQFDPSGGLGTAFEFTSLTPVYTSATASLNDVLRLTHSATPFVSQLGSANHVDVYFNVDSIANGNIFEGGFFTGLSAADLLMAVKDATFTYWVKDVHGTTAFNGSSYSLLTSVAGITGANVKTIGRTADFGSGNVTGSVTQFVIIPEPDTIIFAGIGIALAGWSIWKRRRVARILRRSAL